MLKKKGFTLIELLVVIAIISILTLITVSQFQTAKYKANDVARKGDLNALSKALNMHFTDYGYFPAGDATGKLIMNGISVDWGDTFEDESSLPAYVYMKVLPNENFLTAFPYCYKTDTEKKKYALFAQLQNTGDKECVGNYTCGGKTGYCYAITSPNVQTSDELLK